MSFAINWYVLNVKSPWVRKMYESLTKVSLNSLFPLLKTIQQCSERNKVILSKLSSSYAFVNINSSLEFRRTLSVNDAVVPVKIYALDKTLSLNNKID
ncbi:transcription termination/antitermination NusG family protein [uncultured Kordia sp.]|uniref:transcription termination/antitermination NusG family protein n=1 Tax=uncultured Kordia sp. TaxID=507699 RepID=UPI00345B6D82